MILDVLNPEQQQVVTHERGPLLVLAGAGSGKTKALTHRVAYLMAEKHVSGEHILAVTFTNKAAQEMRSRVEKLLATQTGFVGQPLLGTFHSLCARFLRADIHYLGFKNSFAIYDTGDQLQVVKGALEKACVAASEVNEVFLGNVVSSNLGQAPARQVPVPDVKAYLRRAMPRSSTWPAD